MSQATRLTALATAVGADIKLLKAGQGTMAFEPWHYVGGAGEPAFQNQWKNYDNDATVPSANPLHRSLRFRKDPFGVVRMSGCIKSTTPANIGVFILPPTHRPDTSDNNFIANCSGGTSGISVRVADGLVYVSIIGTATPGGYIFFDEVEFDTNSVTQVLAGPTGPKGDTGGNATVPMDPWHIVGGAGEPAFSAGWRTLASGTYGTVAFRKDPLGNVHIRGALEATAGHVAGDPIFPLPVGYRPPGRIVIWDTEQNTTVQSRIDVTAAGVLQFGGGTALATGGVVPLDGLYFDTETVTQMPTGPQGPKGDTGGVSVVETLNWNTALLPNFYRSTSDIFSTTINGPGDTLNPPRQAGTVSAHANGSLSQRVWDLDLQVSYTRFRTSGGVWTAWKPDLLLPPLLTGLVVGAPAAQDGDERYFQNAAMLAAGVMWKFRYNANEPTANKWQFVGGSKLAAGPLGDTTTASAPVVALAGGPSITIPLDGVYEACIGATMISNAINSGYATANMYKDATDAGLPISFVFQNTAIGQAVEPFKEGTLTLTAGQVMTVKVNCANSISNRFVNARIAFRPVRVLM